MKRSSRQSKRTNWKSLSDSDLRNSAIQGRPTRDLAWREMVRRHGPRVWQAVSRTLLRVGARVRKDLVEDLVEGTWIRIMLAESRILRTWDPSRGRLGNFLARIGMWEALTWWRLSARRRQVPLNQAQLGKLAAQPDAQMNPEETARLKESERRLETWEAQLGRLDREVLRLRRDGKGPRAIARLVARSHSTIIAISQRLERDTRRLLFEPEP